MDNVFVVQAIFSSCRKKPTFSPSAIRPGAGAAKASAGIWNNASLQQPASLSPLQKGHVIAEVQRSQRKMP